jgi:CRP-like cAMP-binding protein
MEKFHADEYMIEQGDDGDKFYVLIKGEVCIEKA